MRTREQLSRTMLRVIEAGMLAGLAGVGVVANPFNRGTLDARLWEVGLLWVGRKDIPACLLVERKI